jgi:hypothetical protein
VKALASAIFSRSLLGFVYQVITVIECIGLAINGSLGTAAAALVGWALCFFASSTFVGSFLARREKKYRAADLLGIGAIAVVLIACGLARSGVAISMLDIDGRIWALLGIAVGAFIVRKKDAL